MQNAFKAISDNREIIGFFVVVLGTFLITVQTIITAVKAFTAAQLIFNAVMAANPIGLVITAVAVFTAAVIYLATQTTFFQDAWVAMSEFVSKAWEKFKEVFVKVVKELGNFFGGIVKEISTSWKKMTDAIGRAIQSAGKFIKGIWDGLVEGVNNGISSIGSFFESTWDGVTNFFRGVVNGYISIFESFFNFVIGGANGLIRALNRISIDVPGTAFTEPFTIGVNLPTLSKLSIPRLADGGIVMPTPGGILANIGEGGQPEAVIPLDRMNGVGTTNNIKIVVNAGMGTDGQRVGQQIVDEILKFERNSGRVFARA